MRRTFPSSSNLHRWRGGRSFYVALFLLFICVVVALLAPSFFPTIIYNVSAPLGRTRDEIAGFFSGFFDYLVSKETLTAENRRLSTELELARQELLASGFPENERLATSSVEKSPGRDLLADVLLRPPLSPYDTLVLEAGADAGVSLGDTVTSLGGVALGSITEVFRDFSRATLLSAPANDVTVLIGTKGLQASAHGVGGGAFEALLPQEAPVAKGDIVVLPGRERISLGAVESLEHRDVDFLQLVRFRIPVNIFEQRTVLIKTGAPHAP